jgi:hypothetical protein
MILGGRRNEGTPRPTLTNRGWGASGFLDALVEILRRVSQSPGDWEAGTPQDDKVILWRIGSGKGATVLRVNRREPRIPHAKTACGARRLHGVMVVLEVESKSRV